MMRWRGKRMLTFISDIPQDKTIAGVLYDV